nr:could be an antifreeze protein [Rhizobium sp. Q54]
MPGVIETVALIVSSVATTTLAANALYLGTMALAYAGLAYGAALVQGLFVQKPSVPKPEDGSYNLKQNVPPLAYVLGMVKKGGDYVFLEERSGYAYHIMVQAGHRIKGYVQHYLHDEKLVLNAAGDVVSPAHFYKNGFNHVVIKTRLGLGAETAYAEVMTMFPEIWTPQHRGDGLASVMMSCASVEAEDYLEIYPNQMPQHSAVLEGHAEIFDPRSGGYGYTTNLALFRLWHLTHPVGGKMSLDDMYLPEWQHAANVGDQIVINRIGGVELRYHGGMWFRANNDPVEVGRNLDQAAELVVYERPDGLVGVHSGEFVEPDVRLTRSDIISIQIDGNTRDAATVLAVRGRYADKDMDFNTADAAIYGDPYVDDTERTKTVDNVCIQSHNHVQRLQKITYTRANAPRIAILAHYEAAKNVPYRRFVRVHYPPKATEVVVEITSSPKLSLRNLTVEFSGIVVPETLYDFNAATEEGEPGASVVVLPPGGVPDPVNFNVVIQNEVISGGGTAAFAKATWDIVDNRLIHELEWEPTNGSEPPRSVTSKAGDTEVRSSYLADGVQYRFRLTAWGNGTPSTPTAYQTLTATADPVPPGVVTSPSLIGGDGDATFSWIAPNSANYFAARLYMSTTNTFSSATLVATEYGASAANDARSVTGLSAGTYYGWIVAINASGVASAAVATGPATVT